MTGYQRRNLTNLTRIGLILTLLVWVLHMLGVFLPLERRLSDQRTAWCQFHLTPPTDELVHLDIDDSALDSIHRWPWPRRLWAQVLDELRLAGTRTVAFDILFTEPQRDELAAVPSPDDDTGDDAQFARAIAAHGRVILPATFTLQPPWPAYQDGVAAIIAKPALLRGWGDYEQAISRHEAPPMSQDEYLVVRRRALFELLVVAMKQDSQAGRPLTLMAARERFFPDLDPAITSSPSQRLLERQYRKAAAYVSIHRHDGSQARPAHVVEAADVTPPISLLAPHVAYSGFVDVVPDPDGVVRAVAAKVRIREGEVFDQLGLALAKLHGHRVDPPLDRRGRVLIPWQGPVQDWQGVVGHERHLAIGYVWEAAHLAESLNANRRTADRAIYDLYRLALDPAKASDMRRNPLDFEDDAGRLERITRVMQELASLGYPEALSSLPAADLSEDERSILAAMAALRAVMEQNPRLAERLAERRVDLRARLHDKAVLVGYAASGLGDIITTPLHARSPGVVAHGAIFNAAVTGGFWREAPLWVEWPILLILGLGATVLAATLTPVWSLAAMLALVALYAAVNGLVVFDRWQVQLALAGPIHAAAIAWAGCTLAGFIAERQERARITRRFQNYVDPTLVNYVLEHPDKARLEGEARTMSVVFTDLEGFTRLSSTIHERVVPVINRYLERMIPPIHAHRGYVNKFLGDGIMFFFGAPWENQRHAHDALASIMEMQRLMEPFNAELQAEGLPTLRMRAGMTTGRMIVGDAGSGQRSDYTVMGDQVNLAARLESANKATGTQILINDAAADAVQDHYLLRPVGRLQVVGRSEAVMCFEPLVPLADATDAQRRMVRLTHRMIQAYTESRWDDCLAAADELADCDDASTALAALYRSNVESHRQGADDTFDGRIELTRK